LAQANIFRKQASRPCDQDTLRIPNQVAMVSMLKLVALVASGVAVAEASAFLQKSAHMSISKQAVEQMLAEAGSMRLSNLIEQLRPTFVALPKNAHGRLDPPTVRYVLHRYFVQKHGWYVKGLDPEGAGWKATSDSSTTTSEDIMKGLAPAYIQELFARRGHNEGLNLEELAVFAETLNDLIVQEGLGDFRDVYQTLELSIEEPVSEVAFDQAIRGYLGDLITGDHFDFKHKHHFQALEVMAKDFYPEYDDIVMWSRDLYHTHNFLEKHMRNPFIVMDGVSYERAGGFLREFVHNFGTLSEDECRTLKSDLMSIEQPGTGRVLLSDFYAKDLQLHESVDYLRNLGALENETGTPMLLMANYISSPSRCMPFSSYYSICCPDECDSLMVSLERGVGQPSASPARIAELVSALPSDTVDAPRNLSTALLGRLEEIAGHHGGMVPLHGRLFLQWMHHAYPRECPLPHAAGTTSPVTQDEWLRLNEHLDDVMASQEERETHLNAGPLAQPLAVEDLPWSRVEELVAQHRSTPSGPGASYMRIAVCLVVLLSFAWPLVRASKTFVASAAVDKIHLV